MKRVIVTGDDPEAIGRGLERAGASVKRITGPVTTSALNEANIDETDLLVLTDVGEATAIPLARESNPGIRVVVYAGDALPAFASHQADLVIDPAAVDRSVVIEAVLDEDGLDERVK